LLGLRYDNRYFTYANQHTHFEKATVRDQNAILKSASGFLKLFYPDLNLTPMDYQRDCLEPARQLRQGIRNSLYYLDDEFRSYGREIFVEAVL
ncbi:MAG: TIGR02688 family protein, partial [Kamptonema sp. SIO4C4]|nr:TIGR02688 family protein [Kamptonema sp. SIO4C4]